MPWTELDTARLPNGEVMTLRQSGADFEIRVGLYELMSSKNPGSERAMAKLATARLGRSAGRVLIGGLGMGYTVRAMLDESGPEARLTVAELVPQVIAWNRGPLAALAGHPLADPRVEVATGDVADIIRRHPGAFDIILMDVDNGPEAVMFDGNRPLYSADGLSRVMAGLTPGGVLALWAADPSPSFERAAAGVRLDRTQVDVTGIAHTIYLAAR
jgi:spermidine synthase